MLLVELERAAAMSGRWWQLSAQCPRGAPWAVRLTQSDDQQMCMHRVIMSCFGAQLRSLEKTACTLEMLQTHLTRSGQMGPHWATCRARDTHKFVCLNTHVSIRIRM